MSKTMTIAGISVSEEFRNQLKIALEHPALEMALHALEQDNMPELKIQAAPGMDIMDVIALDAAKRAGAQSVIRRLRRLPFLTQGSLARARAVGGSWEYLEPSEAETVSKPKKAKP